MRQLDDGYVPLLPLYFKLAPQPHRFFAFVATKDPQLAPAKFTHSPGTFVTFLFAPERSTRSLQQRHRSRCQRPNGFCGGQFLTPRLKPSQACITDQWPPSPSPGRSSSPTHRRRGSHRRRPRPRGRDDVKSRPIPMRASLCLRDGRDLLLGCGGR